ncbi:MAG TPA: hypothetical protein VIG66_04595, partial [Noviherbaspirillum sp.]
HAGARSFLFLLARRVCLFMRSSNEIGKTDRCGGHIALHGKYSETISFTLHQTKGARQSLAPVDTNNAGVKSFNIACSSSREKNLHSRHNSPPKALMRLGTALPF